MRTYELPFMEGQMQQLADWPNASLLGWIRTETKTGSWVFPFVSRIGTQESQLDSAGFKDARKKIVDEAKDMEAQWGKLVLERNAEVTANALSATVKPLFKALSSLGAGAIDLRSLPAERVNGVHLAVVLRATLSQKELTPGWEEALEVARAALRRDGIDEADALIGMI